MLTSPISVTIGSDTFSLVRINQDNFGASYLAKGANVEVTLDIRHQRERANVDGQYERHNFDLRKTVFDPTGAVSPRTYQSYTVLRAPRGTLSTLLEEVVDAQLSLLDTRVAQIVAWES